MLYNALECPNAEMIRMVLEHNPVNKMFDIQTPHIKMSTADRILSLYSLGGTFAEEQQLVSDLLSWANRGAPLQWTM